MGKKIILSIDNHEIHSQQKGSIIEAADQAGIYIPRLCHHPDLSFGPGTKAQNQVHRCGEIISNGSNTAPEYSGCNICIVQIEGRGLFPACATVVEDGMVIFSDTADVREKRKQYLAKILSQHPHSCFICSEKEGCDRTECMQGVQISERCCSKFDDCELRMVSEWVTIQNDVSRYIFKNIPLMETPLFIFNPNLCIGCTRCIRACEKMDTDRVIGFVNHTNGCIIGTLKSSHKESGCRFCGACVEVCPTGALMDKGIVWKKRMKLNFRSLILPPKTFYECTEENIKKVPEENGVYELMNKNHTVIFIHGVPNLRNDLLEKLTTIENACFFRFEEHGMYTMRETEMLEKHLNKHGALPEVNDEISDLY